MTLARRIEEHGLAWMGEAVRGKSWNNGRKAIRPIR